MRSLALAGCLTLAAGLVQAAPKKQGAAKRPAPESPQAPAAALPAAAAPDSAAPAAPRGPARIDFDDRLIQGQSNKSGAVYLYDRKELKVRSMVKKRESFRDEIVGTLYEP
ncbi:MAG: hypothetical protein INH41_04775 [Myxococcaceae bacterium]|jgi:hypothetical protein|nr:hypothetical protein [Myxococcaceae bacterium]